MSWVTTVLGLVALVASILLAYTAFVLHDLLLELARKDQMLEWTEQSREQTWLYCDQLVDQLTEAQNATLKLLTEREDEGEGECSTRP